MPLSPLRTGEREHMDNEKLTLGVMDAAKAMGVSRVSLYGLIRGGKIPSVKVGKRLMIPSRSLDALLKDRT